MTYNVVYTPAAEEHLIEIENYIAGEASPAVAVRYVDRLIDRCERLSVFPRRGTPRDDIRPGLRTITHRRTATIAYVIEAHRVVIVAILRAGRELAEL